MALQGRDTTHSQTHGTSRKRHNSEPNTWYLKEEAQLIALHMVLQGRDTTHRFIYDTA